MHSFSSSLYHCVFATKQRQALLTASVCERLYPYFGGIARKHKMGMLAIGGVEDHVHLLLSLPSTLAIAKAMQLLKGNSSKWISESFPPLRNFEWQGGYGAFSIGISGVEETKRYIEGQREHHRSKTFREEVIAFLIRHRIPYEDWMID
jgi:REP element-mobilizing transposase RayT